MSTNTTNEPKKPMQITVDKHEQFEKLASTAMETTQRLAKRINKYFSAGFSDYYGSTVFCTAGNGNVNPNQQFMVELHFKPMTAGSIDPNDKRVRAFKPIEEGTTGNDIVSNLKSFYGSLHSSAKFQLTEEGAQILADFILPGVNNGLNVDPWKPSTFASIKSEYVDAPQFGQSPIMVKVSAVDLVKLIRRIYGTKTDDGKRVDYGVIPYGPVTPNINNQMVQGNANWRVMIMQIDADKTIDLASEFGLIPSGNGGSVITGI